RAAVEPSFEAIGLNRDDGTLAQGRERVECRLDLAQLDPVASALDLRVGTAQEIEQTVGAAVRQIAGLVNAVAWTRPTGTRKKHAIGLLLVAPVARAQAGASDVEVADLAGGHGLQSPVEDQQLLAVACVADGDRLALVARATRDGIVAAGDGRFGRTVKIGEARVWQTPHPMDQGRRRDRLPAPHHPAQTWEVVLADDIE